MLKYLLVYTIPILVLFGTIVKPLYEDTVYNDKPTHKNNFWGPGRLHTLIIQTKLAYNLFSCQSINYSILALYISTTI